MAMDLTYLLKGYKITNTAKVVYGLLLSLSRASAARGKSYTYISQATIAERVGVCERTAHSAIKQLAEAGLIIVKRRGQGLNNRTYVLPPKATEAKQVVTTSASAASAASAASINCGSRTATIAVPNVNRERVSNTTDSKLSIPNGKDQGYTAPKGRPTNKRPRKNTSERQRMKQKYREYLIERLQMVKMRHDLLSDGQEIAAMETAIDLISTTAASNGKIMCNSALITSAAWWHCVKNISHNALLELIYRIEKKPDIKNYRAYFLSAVYNEGMRESLSAPFYDRLA